MRSYFKVYRSADGSTLRAHQQDSTDTLVFIEQFNKARAILAFNSLGFYATWKAYDADGNNLATFTGSQLANGLYIIGAYAHHPEN